MNIWWCLLLAYCIERSKFVYFLLCAFSQTEGAEKQDSVFGFKRPVKGETNDSFGNGKRHMAGETEQDRVDLARLAIVRAHHLLLLHFVPVFLRHARCSHLGIVVPFILFMNRRQMCLTFEYCILIMLFLALYVGAPAQRGGCCQESRRGQSAGHWHRVWREQVRCILYFVFWWYWEHNRSRTWVCRFFFLFSILFWSRYWSWCYKFICISHSNNRDSDDDKLKKGPAGKAPAASVAAPSKAKDPVNAAAAVNAAEVAAQKEAALFKLNVELDVYQKMLEDPSTSEPMRLRLLDLIRATRDNCTELLRQQSAGKFHFFCRILPRFLQTIFYFY